MRNIVEHKPFVDVTNNLFNANFIEKGIGVSKWNVRKNNVSYFQANIHTLSLYLCGGDNSFRNDNKSLKGGPGKICLMPQNQASLWQINDQIEFIHIYFSEDYLKKFASLNLDVDIRNINLRDVIYDSNATIKAMIVNLYQLSRFDEQVNLLAKEELQMQLMHKVINCYNENKIRNEFIASGLSMSNIQRVKQAIFDDISSAHTIHGLANIVNLSPFHFAKMFKLSVGLTPAQYILQCRFTLAKNLLKTHMPLIEITYLAGFSHQSHMSAVFKKFLGVTPLFYRNNL
ncbi:MAG: helix-turn-helix transcriptional regulator [Colwellia sp.]|nr:helix-turn-helix transcriptional regulator [Colwellia sp.]